MDALSDDDENLVEEEEIDDADARNYYDYKYAMIYKVKVDVSFIHSTVLSIEKFIRN